jgi:hypothetical protein
MAERYGTDLTGLGGYEGGVNSEQGAALLSTSSDGETSLLFGSAALREIQAGIANGDFAIPPDDTDADLSEDNPLPYFTTTTVGAGVTAAVVEDTSAGSQTTLRFRVAGGTLTGNSVAISRFVPIPATRNRAFLFVPEVFCINATATANARVTIAYQYFELDQTTSTGTGDSTFETFTTIGGASTIRFTANQLRFNAPSDAAFIKVTVTCSTTGTVAAQSDVFVCELRLITGQQDLWIAERTSPSTTQGARIVQESGDLRITPVVGGTGSITLNAATDVSGGLEVTGNIDAGGSIASVTLIQAGGVFRTIQASFGSLAFTARVTGEGTPRFAVFCNGAMEWGAGGARDLNLYRSAAGVLKTDFDLNVGDFLTVGGGASFGAGFSAGGTFTGTNINLDGGNGYQHDEPRTTTQTSSAAIWTSPGGTIRRLARNTSSARYKTNIVDADEVVLDAARKVKARHYESTIEDENGATRLGFIAEEIHEAGLTHAVGYDADGKPETLDPVALIAALWHRVNDLESRLRELEK